MKNKVIREKADDVLTESKFSQNWMLRLVKGLKRVRSKEVKSERIIWKGS